MHSIQALREQRAVKAKAVSDRVNKKGVWTPEDQKAYDEGMAEVDALAAQIERINASNRLLAEDALDERLIVSAERIARDQRSPGAALFAKWMRQGLEGLNAEELQAVRNTMSVGTAGQGGYTVATEISREILEALKAFGGMRAVATVISTSTGHPMQYPTSDGTSEMGELIGENAPATALDPSFGTVGLTTYKYSSKIIAVPFELLQDSEADVEAFVRRRMVQRLGRVTNRDFTTGSGTGAPNGVVTAVATGKVGLTGQTATVIYDDLVDLEHSVDPAYRELNNTKWMMNDSSLRQIRKIKDTVGRPIFAPGYENVVAGASGSIPDRLLGHPIQINQDLAAMAANAKSILYGDFSFYTIRDVMEVSMFRFTDSAFTIKGQVGFLAWMRAGGNFVDVGGAVKAYANSAT